MATKIIPARTVFTCDGCKVEEPRRVLRGSVEIDRGGTGGQSWELCDQCIMRMETVITKAIKELCP